MKSAQAIVVLGGGLYFDTPEYGGDTVGGSTLERLRYAATIARKTNLPVLVTGGAGWAGGSPVAARYSIEPNLWNADVDTVQISQVVHNLVLNAVQAMPGGGMIDIEFIVQALVLLHAREMPELAENKGNIALLLRAAARGLLPEALAAQCADAYRVFRARQHALRLQAEGDAGPARIPTDELAPARAAVITAWNHVFGAVACA